MALAAVTLDDKYTLEQGRVYMTGTQALVRLPMMQRRRDVAAGLDTGCFISGYRGSPLGGFDQSLWRARRFLAGNHVHFQPGVNEELGATAVWGSQQLHLWPGAKYDGVFSMWYGKGPGVDRCGDVFKHANAAGTSPGGGVLALAGDDHACKSSTFPHQSEHAFVAAMIPVLNPAGVQEILDYGLLGWAMSRFSGCWIALKTIAETVDSSASVSIDPDRARFVLPDFEMPPGGLHIRWPDPPLEQEERLMKDKLYAALAFARANGLDKVMIASPRPRLGIVTTGKSYLDVRQALDDLGIGEEMAADLGLTVYKVAMPWPLEREGVRHFAEGLEEIVVVEEKRAVIENQLKEQLYNWHPDVRPRVVGKFDEQAREMLPAYSELSPARIAVEIGRRLLRFVDHEGIRARVEFLDRQESRKALKGRVQRKAWFCSGCPHNTSTRVPEGSRATAGIGCHYMVTWMDRSTDTFTQMGGEGVPWIGQAPFTGEKHIFANLGDGTYYHSGILAIRAALAANVNITYKILFNDAVAMTGGQPVDGTLTVPMIVDQLAAEGVRRIVVVTDEPEKYANPLGIGGGVKVEHRRELDRVQKDLRETEGVSILIYDQTCAAEKRRRRKRKIMVDPPKRVLINEQVCEGCGDCSRKSNCLSVVPVETEFGRKRQIDQSSCNKDFSCLEGFCPSFVTVHGGRLKKPAAAGGDTGTGTGTGTGTDWIAGLPEPALPDLDQPYGILVTGVGGTGVVTIGALIGMAAHLEGKGCSVLDMTGLAQKGGAVTSHLRIARRPDDIHAVRIAAGGARAVLGCDIVVAAGGDALSKMAPGVTHAVMNAHETVTADFTRDPNFKVPVNELLADVERQVGGKDALSAIDATRLATALLGDSIAANPFMLGYAWQKGLVPVGADALLKAIEMNGVAVDMNTRAFHWGRRAAVDPAAVETAATPRGVRPAEARPGHRKLSESLDEMIERRTRYLSDYQDAAYAARYRAQVDWTRTVEQQKTRGMRGLTEAVARNYFKVLAYKDEYEVARLYTEGGFLDQIRDTFEGDYRIEFNMAPPLLAERDPETGHLRKKTFGPWMLKAFGLLARMKRLRGTAFDPFGRTGERRQERRLIADYERTLAELLGNLDPANHALAVEIASIPEQIRGFGHIKEDSMRRAKETEAKLIQQFRDPPAHPMAAE
ncbi:MAG TPA: indolepyruvate ferredoxin oxidoreductase family protein [Arenibaculum sp.]|nr:indolepyruvate ferredoxin oxidoreductase family protein [Arenibaculum sp.]